MFQGSILIDGNAVARACHHAQKLTVGSFQTQAIFGSLRLLRRLAHSYSMHDILYLWDGRAEHRFAMYPEYKANRAAARAADPEKEADHRAYEAQVPLLRKAIQAIGVNQLTASNLEADDLAGYFAPRMSKAGRRVLLVTGDTDWLQMVDENVTWLDHREDGKLVTHQNFLEMTGYHSPREYLQGKALVGDSTDGIGPVGGIGKETAPVLLARFKSIEAFFDACEKGTHKPNKTERSLWQGRSEFSKDEWKARFVGDPADAKALKKHMDSWPGQGRVLWERNMKLMNLLDGPAPDPAKLEKCLGEFSIPAFRAICDRLGFASITRDMGTFIEPFQQRWQARIALAAA